MSRRIATTPEQLVALAAALSQLEENQLWRLSEHGTWVHYLYRQINLRPKWVQELLRIHRAFQASPHLEEILAQPQTKVIRWMRRHGKDEAARYVLTIHDIRACHDYIPTIPLAQEAGPNPIDALISHLQEIERRTTRKQAV